MPPGGLPAVDGLGAVVAAAGRAACGFSASFGRSLDGAGRVGIAGTADVPGADGSSIRKRMLGGTIRPGACGAGAGAAGFGGAGATAGSTTTGGGSIATGGGSARVPAAASGGVAGSALSTTGGASIFSSTGAAGAAGLTVFTSRGGANDGAAGFTGSGFFSVGTAGFFPFTGGPSANMSPPGSVIPRSRARRSTN